jgi:hypothetical protein
MNPKKETERFTAEEVLEQYFPKGHKQRGNALLLFAVSKLEGRTQTLGKVKEKIDIWASNSILTFDDDSIAQTKLKDDICKYVKELKQFISKLEDDEVKE